jgi:hypothetical protein
LSTWPTNTNNIADRYNFFCYGEALVDFGLVVGCGIDGNGLVTRGLVWQGYEIWGPAVGPVTTSWADSNPVITTVWSLTWAEYPSIL